MHCSIDELASCDIIILLFGETGVGKSTFGNLLLGEKDLLKESNGGDPCTSEPSFEIRIVNGYKLALIDTEGFEDGKSPSDDQIKKLVLFLNKLESGISAFGLVLLANTLRFNRNIQDDIRFLYNSLKKDVFNHFFMAFTYSSETFPDREQKNTMYRELINKHIKSFSKIENVPDFPMFFVDSKRPEADFVKNELDRLFKWASSLPKMSTKEMKAVPLKYTVEEEEEIFSLGLFEDGENTIEKFVLNMRDVWVPNDNSGNKYGEWIKMKDLEPKLIIETITENKQEVRPHHIPNDENEYEVTVEMERKNKKDHRTGLIEEGKWYDLNTSDPVVVVQVTPEYKEETKEHLEEGSENKYEVIQYYQRTNKINLKTNETEYGQWVITKESEPILVVEVTSEIKDETREIKEGHNIMEVTETKEQKKYHNKKTNETKLGEWKVIKSTDPKLIIEVTVEIQKEKIEFSKGEDTYGREITKQRKTIFNHKTNQSEQTGYEIIDEGKEYCVVHVEPDKKEITEVRNKDGIQYEYKVEVTRKHFIYMLEPSRTHWGDEMKRDVGTPKQLNTREDHYDYDTHETTDVEGNVKTTYIIKRKYTCKKITDLSTKKVTYTEKQYTDDPEIKVKIKTETLEESWRSFDLGGVIEGCRQTRIKTVLYDENGTEKETKYTPWSNWETMTSRQKDKDNSCYIC